MITLPTTLGPALSSRHSPTPLPPGSGPAREQFRHQTNRSTSNPHNLAPQRPITHQPPTFRLLTHSSLLGSWTSGSVFVKIRGTGPPGHPSAASRSPLLCFPSAHGSTLASWTRCGVRPLLGQFPIPLPYHSHYMFRGDVVEVSAGYDSEAEFSR